MAQGIRTPGQATERESDLSAFTAQVARERLKKEKILVQLMGRREYQPERGDDRRSGSARIVRCGSRLIPGWGKERGMTPHLHPRQHHG